MRRSLRVLYLRGMIARFSVWGSALGFSLAAAATLAACGSNGSSAGTAQGGTGGSHSGSGTASGGANTGGASDGAGGTTFVTSSTGNGGAMQGLDVQPSALQTITVNAGQITPSVTYTATLNGSPISAGWGLDKGNVGTIPAGPSTTATFSPTGTAGGVVTISAGLNNITVQRQVLVQLVASQNGPDPTSPAEQAQIPTTTVQLKGGGGVGGVGGEGLGTAVADPGTLTALQTPTGDTQALGLKFIYPYDKTVWPRGILAPLLMWNGADADAIQIQLKTTSGSFSWTGTFGRPAILAQTGGGFIRHPIPQDIWDMATNSAGGADQLTVSLTVAKGGVAYGPIQETWTIAAARLSGTIYYNSYGTQLAQNLGGAIGGNHLFGGAVLSIRVGDTAPQLVAGGNGAEAACRVCHSVAANGSRLLVQHGDSYNTSSAYDLSPSGSTEHVLANGATFPAVYPDGSMALSETGQLLPLPDDSVPLPISGLSAVATDLGSPTFAPSGALVAFNPMAGPGLVNPRQKLVVMAFDKATMAFTNPKVVVDDTGQPAETRPGWPAFFPDSNSVVFHHQSAAGYDGNALGPMNTRGGARAEIAWTTINNSQGVTPLNQLNGRDAAGNSYLPKLAQPSTLACTGDGHAVGNIDADHGNDVTLNYEPTVNPVASGGYAWVVFTSRRMYGSVATIPPYCSDPRGVDLIQNITPKKLWVAAINLDAAPATDASHPAFYLPAQELLAGNSRGFWVLDPCKSDGQTCATGDQCCNGYCEPNGPDGALECSNTPPNGMCSAPQEKCTTAADCCDPANVCVNGFCAQKGIN